jgi:hypothetical protein
MLQTTHAGTTQTSTWPVNTPASRRGPTARPRCRAVLPSNGDGPVGAVVATVPVLNDAASEVAAVSRQPDRVSGGALTTPRTPRARHTLNAQPNPVARIRMSVPSLRAGRDRGTYGTGRHTVAGQLSIETTDHAGHVGKINNNVIQLIARAVRACSPRLLCTPTLRCIRTGSVPRARHRGMTVSPTVAPVSPMRKAR